MYIALRTGGGRGVYEIAGATATGLTSAELLGRELVFDFPPVSSFHPASFWMFREASIGCTWQPLTSKYIVSSQPR